MFRKALRFFVIATLAVTYSQTVYGQEKEIQIESFSGGRSRTVEINRPGVYRISGDILVNGGDGIVVTASNVTLNLNGNSVTTLAAGIGRGIFVNGASGVQIRNGRIGGFNSNVMIMNSTNVNIESLQIVGRGLAPSGGPTEIGAQIVNSRAVFISRNNISSVNLGIFVRGGNSAGNRIFENVIVGSGTPANNLLGICYNPAAGGAGGPRGDNIYNNHISRFGYAVAISADSLHNIFNENTLASFNGGFREPEALTGNGGTNVSEGNIEVTISADVLP